MDRSIDWLQQMQLSLLNQSDPTLLIAGGSVVVGILCGFNLIVLEWISSIRLGYCNIWYLNYRACCSDKQECADFTYYSDSVFISFIVYNFVSMLCFGISLLFVYKRSHLIGSGLPQLKYILSGFQIPEFFSISEALHKSQSTLFLIGSGIYLSYQETMVHTSCSIFNYLFSLQSTQNEAQRRSLLSVASAIGIAIAFNSNMGGILFSLEEASFYFPINVLWKSFLGCLIATSMSNFLTPNLQLFQTNWTREWHLSEIPFFVLVGFLGGTLGALFITFNIRFLKFKRSLTISSTKYNIGYLLISNLLLFSNKMTTMNPFLLMSQLFQDCSLKNATGICANTHVPGLLFASLVIFASSLSSYGHYSGGYYISIMTVGALLGKCIGIATSALKHIYPFYFYSCTLVTDACIAPGLYALIGSAALFTGVTKCTVSTIVIMMELSGQLKYIVPMLIAVTISKYTSDYFCKNGLTVSYLEFLNLPYLSNRLELHSDLPISALMTKEVIAIPNGIPYYDLLYLLDSTINYFPITTSTGEFMGVCHKQDILTGLDYFKIKTNVYFDHGEGIVLRPFIDTSPISVHPKQSMTFVIKLFQRLGLRYVVVLDKNRFKGLLSRRDAIQWINMK